MCTASGMAEALAMLDEWPPKVLVSDIGRPDGEGYSLTRAVGQRGHGIPAVALTAYVRSEDRRRAFNRASPNP